MMLRQQRQQQAEIGFEIGFELEHGLARGCGCGCCVAKSIVCDRDRVTSDAHWRSGEERESERNCEGGRDRCGGCDLADALAHDSRFGYRVGCDEIDHDRDSNCDGETREEGCGCGCGCGCGYGCGCDCDDATKSACDSLEPAVAAIECAFAHLKRV